MKAMLVVLLLLTAIASAFLYNARAGKSKGVEAARGRCRLEQAFTQPVCSGLPGGNSELACAAMFESQSSQKVIAAQKKKKKERQRKNFFMMRFPDTRSSICVKDHRGALQSRAIRSKVVLHPIK